MHGDIIGEHKSLRQEPRRKEEFCERARAEREQRRGERRGGGREHELLVLEDQLAEAPGLLRVQQPRLENNLDVSKALARVEQ